MANRDNLADADFEPSDDQLEDLSRKAFAGVRERRRAALARVHAEVAMRREAVLAAIRARLASRKST
jgi:hypothetical protein